MLDKLRNIGIIAHVDAGKTTTTERILYYSGTKHKFGDVDDGDTTTDFDPLERQKGITINSAAVSIDWKDSHDNDVAINIIDTPGHVDFTAEVERSLRVLDGGVCVFCAVGGVEVQSETVWFQANKYKVPRIAYINKLDRLGSDFKGCVKEMQTKLHCVPAICAIPVGESSEFKGIIDLIENKFVLKDDTDKTHVRKSLVEIPESHQDIAAEYREKLLDTASLADDEMAEMILEGKEISKERLIAALRKGTIEGKFNPVYCGSSKTFHGVQVLLDAVVNFLPSPLDRPPVEAINPKTKEKVIRNPDPKDPFSGLAFKTVAESNGDLVYVRVYSGVLKQGASVINTTFNRGERIARLYRMMGNTRQELDEAQPGAIVAVVGLKNTYTGNTLCDEDHPVALESISFPKPVISAALTTGKTVDTGKLGEALGRMTRDDPTIKVHTDEETKDTILSGMGELHLEITLEKIKRTLGLPQGDPILSLGKPRVAYRQTLGRATELVTKFVKQTGGRGKFAVIHVRYTPLDAEGIEKWTKQTIEDGDKPDPNNVYFASEIVGGVVPKEYVPSVEDGIRNMAKRGSKYPFPFVDLECVLFDGKIHPVDSSQDAFRMAAEENFRDVQQAVGIKLLEPIMTVVAVSPEQYQGSITGDINRRRGVIEEITSEKGRGIIRAKVPLANLFGYTSDLRGATSGTASFSMEFSHYAEVNESLADIPKPDKK
ncbi:elongation factor G [Zavarzinella formosa]|uniref:elongation factor G n=1 Tax=Zavarzinella formosa TaxID=360055 RepID=UPI0002FEF856|nr:elongation factor G [Zavarzinella formosa]